MQIDFDLKSKELSITKEIYLRILKKAIAQASEDVETLQTAIHDNNAEQAQTISHRFKGDFANLRIDEISGPAKMINDIAKTGCINDVVKESFQKIQDTIEQLKSLM